MRSPWIRSLLGSFGLLAAVWMTASATPPGADIKTTLPPGETSALISADMDFLEKALQKRPSTNAVATIKATALQIALNAQNSMSGPDGAKMAAVRASALVLAKAANTDGGSFAEKDFKAAAEAFKELKAASGKGESGAIPVAKIVDMSGIDLDWLMRGAFKPPAKVGTIDMDKAGRQVEKNIRDMAQKKKPVDVALAKDAGLRSVVIGEFTMAMLPEDAKKNPAKQKQWDNFTKEMIAVGQEVAAEGSKAKADKAELQKKLSKLDGTCVACHEVFKK